MWSGVAVLGRSPGPGVQATLNFASRSEAPVRTEFLLLLRIYEFFGFQWQNLTEIMNILPKVLQSENKAVIISTLSPSAVKFNGFFLIF